MKITLAETAGFCFGVKRAVDMVYELCEQGQNVCTLGPIIHNAQLVADLEQKGVRVVEDVSQVKYGEILVIRSHGVPESVMNEAATLEVKTVDATCPFVAKIHKIVKEASENGRIVLIAGDAKHKEVIGIIGHSLGPVYVFEDENSLLELLEKEPKLKTETVSVVAQTTFNEKIWSKCEKILKKYCTNASIFGTICNATSMRQSEAHQLSLKNDAMVVIGGQHSSNTKKLYDVCKVNCEKTFLIETANELKAEFFDGAKNIGVVAGASTPAAIIKEAIKTMTEILNPVEEQAEVAEVVQKSFEEMTDEEAFEASLDSLNSDKKVKGVVVQVTPSEILVDYNRGLTGYVSADEYSYDRNVDLTKEVKVGDELNLIIMRTDDMEGTAMLSKRRYDAIAGWDKVVEAKETNEVLTGTVSEVVKGGVVVLTNGIRVFIPASQATLSRNDSLEELKGQEVNFRIIEIGRRRRVIGSIRSILREQRKEEMAKFWEEINVGDKFTGTVKSLTGYGAFVDLGGVDGMIHITELSWQRIKNPSEVVLVGDTVEVFVKAVDKEKRKISLGYKKDDENPWTIFQNNYNVDDVVKATIVSMTTYGAFARIIPGIDGLIHISQIADKHVAKPQDELTVGQEVEAKIIAVDLDKKRVSLSIRALIEPEVKEEAPESAENEVVATASEEEVVVADSVAEEIAE
ncbi:MAG: bifunctional 4-hydroxy-3-methylbut-2-enyl diphosphate reductase/30S ribosomal protein S1 [Clostridia bacterium]|nr:bifunctional 4-hydroxy-3-methylbut-2-enyl diphosphate reductase/30S ribosomal protein S1 [Clostridia bacterium]